MSGECGCCVISCPVPTFECESKDHTLDTLNGYSAFDRYETNPDGTLGSQLADIPPASCQTYATRVFSKGWTTAMSYTLTSLVGDPDEYVTFEEEASGTVALTYTYGHAGCHASDDLSVVGSGTAQTEERDYVQYYDSGDSTYKTYLSEKITIDYEYVGNTTIANPDAGDPGEPATIFVPHGDDAFLKTVTTVTKADENASEVTVIDSELVSYNSITLQVLPPTALDDVKTQTHTLKSTEGTVDYSGSSSQDGSGVYLSSETREDPWTEALIKADFQLCIDGKDWTGSSCISVYDVTENTPGCVDEMRIRQVRYRAIIPHDFDPPPSPFPQKWHGTYHKIEFKETFVPDSGDPDEVTINIVEWTGPGDELDTWSGWGALTETEKDARRDSWKTDWQEVDVPTENGETTVSLYRSQCYHGAPWVYH